jgi:hypothetical protein
MEARWCPRPAIMHWIEPSEIENAAAHTSEQELSIHGVEKTDETGRLCRMVAVRQDLAVHGLEGDIRHGGHPRSRAGRL